MARLIKRDYQSPFVLDKGQLSDKVFVCACGLSANLPFCDGSHKRTRDEAPGQLYVYDEQGRTEVNPPQPK